jgi:hypothetical protein
MNAPTINAQALAKTAQEIVDCKHSNRFLKFEAQLYLDNLSDGYCEPDELLRLLAEEQAEDDFQGVCFTYERRNPGYAYTLDYDEWLEGRKDEYLASVRSTYGMGKTS